MTFASAENGKIRVEFNNPGVHPFITLSVRGDGAWLPVMRLGARHVRYLHKGASFPRLVVNGNEAESAGGVQMSVLPEGDGAVITDARGGLSIRTRLTIEHDAPLVHVVHALVPDEETKVNRVFDRYDFTYCPGEEGCDSLDYHFVPHLRPRSDMVISDQVFRSPVVMMRREDVFFALIPDLELLEPVYRTTGARYYMDFLAAGGENLCPSTSFGLGRTRVKGHTYFENDFQRETRFAAGREFVVAYYLVLDRNGFGVADVVSFLWERFGRRYLTGGLPQVTGWDRYAAAGLERMFKSQDLYRRFSLEGQPCGGTVAMHFVTRKGVRLMDLGELRRYLGYQDLALSASRGIIEFVSEHPCSSLLEKALYRYGPKVPPGIMFQSWFNNLRSAYGAYWFARKWHDSELLESALAVKNLAILAPRDHGASPAVCYATDQGTYWSAGTRGFKHFDWHHTADCATTGYYMTQWFRDHEGDPRLIGRCHELALFLMSAQLPSGAFPAWVKPDGSKPISAPELRERATTACPAMFLAQHFMVENDVRYLESALRAIDFLAAEVIPGQKWFDYETFYSCSRKRLGFVDPNTKTVPQNTMSMYCAAEALRLAFMATLDPVYLRMGLQVLNHLCLYQQVWDPPFLSINAFGGFGSMNTDAEWNDARQALMAPLFMDYYTITGKPEHMERGIAALRAAFTLMFLDENTLVAPGNMKDAPPEETGSVAENYAHFGYDHRVPGFLDSDWGAGSACHAAAYVQRHYGDIYVDLDRDAAFGINGCRVEDFKLEGRKLTLHVEKQIDSGIEVAVKLAGGRRDLDIVVNGTPARKAPLGEHKVLL